MDSVTVVRSKSNPTPQPVSRRPVGNPFSGISNLWLLAGLVAAALGLVCALLYTGAAATRLAADPGAVVRWGYPAVKTIHDIAVAAVIGALVFAAVILPPSVGRRRGKPTKDDAPLPEHPAFTRVMQLASVAGIVWTLSAIAVLVFNYSDIAGLPISSSADYTSQLVYYMTNIANGRAWLAVVIIAAVVTTLTFGVRSLTGLGLTALLAMGGLLPMALIGHSAGGDDHNAAVNSLGLHLIGVCLWVGGIIALAVVSGTLAGGRAGSVTRAVAGNRGGTAGATPAAPAAPGPATPGRLNITAVVLHRFSTLAGAAFVLVVGSGIINASIRIGSWDQLNTTYGGLVVAKTVAALLLGSIGFMHRRWIIPQLTAPQGKKGRVISATRVLWQLVLGELIIMSGTIGIAVALSRSAPPVPEIIRPDASPARLLTGYDLPPELLPGRWLDIWRPDWLWVAIALAGAVGYVAAVRKLRRRGDGWSWPRMLSWFFGLVLLTYFTSGAPAVYGDVLFSAHMVDHMALTMLVPVFLVIGAPVTLALKCLKPRSDGSRGPREWILVVVHSKVSKVITHPIFVGVNFAGSIIIFYFSPLFGLAMRYHVGHELMNTHFLITGYLFVLALIGIDPIPRRAAYPLRLLLLLGTMAFHAFFGVAVMSSKSLLEASWFGNMGRSWGLSALADQQLGGGVAWAIGEIPTLIVAVGVAFMWSRDDARETKRKDRAADRNNEAELSAYNTMFAKLAERDKSEDAPHF